MKEKREPLYLYAYKRLRKEIVDGMYKEGQKLPSKRTFAEAMGISVITAEHAYGLLESEGYIEARQRSGYFCIFKKNDRFLSSVPSDADYPESAKVSTGYGGFPFSLYAKTARRVLSEYGEKILLADNSPADGVLAREIAAYLGRSRGMEVSPGQIIVGSGAEALYGVITDLLGRERIYAAEDPSYEMIEKVYISKGIRYEMLPLGKNGIKSGALAGTSATVLHITPYRSFPSGVTADASKRSEYIRWAEEGDRYIVEDDFESEFTVTGKIYDTVFSSSDKGNVIYMNTFSKSVSPAVRIAYLVLSEPLLSVFKEKFGGYRCTVPVFEQYIMASLLKSGEFERHINRTRRLMRKEKQEREKK